MYNTYSVTLFLPLSTNQPTNQSTNQLISQYTYSLMFKEARVRYLLLAAQPVVSNFHPLPRGNVSITRQPQPGCLLFHRIMSRDHVIVVHLRKQKKPSFLPFKKKKIFFHGHKCCKHCHTCLVFVILSFTYVFKRCPSPQLSTFPSTFPSTLYYPTTSVGTNSEVTYLNRIVK